MKNTRRDFLKKAGLAATVAVASSQPTPLRAAAENTEPMKIAHIDAVTFRRDLHIGGGSGGRDDGAEFMWVRLHTDNGLIGTGETYPFSYSQIGVLKDHVRTFIGKDARDVDGLWRSFYKDQAMRNSGGAEMDANVNDPV